MDFLFHAANHHSASCGPPPQIDEPPKGANIFRSYFENEYGEQWILTHDQSTDEVAVTGGDVGWDERMTVKPVKEFHQNLPAELASQLRSHENEEAVCGSDGPVIMGEGERLWVTACMTIVGYRRRART